MYNPIRGGTQPMGKKRRYIHRAKKFATKAFHFLDGIDGTEDGIITDSAGYIEDIIESITLTKDRGNQTVALDCRLAGTDWTGKFVQYKIKDHAGNSKGTAAVPVAKGSSKDINTFTAPAGELTITGGAGKQGASDSFGLNIILDPGSYTITAQAFDNDGQEPASIDTNKPLTAEPTPPKKMKIKRSPVNVSAAAGFILDSDDASTSDGQLSLDISKITATGYQPGAEVVYSAETGANGKGYLVKVQITSKPDDDEDTVLNTDVPIGNDGDATTIVIESGDVPAAERHDDILTTALAVAGEYGVKVTFVPLDLDDGQLPADAITVTGTIKKAE